MSKQPILEGPPLPPAEFDIDASLVRLAMTIVPKVEIRWYLCGALIEARPEGGAFIVSTDGHRMLIIIDEKAKAPAYPVIVRPSNAMLKAMPKPEPLYPATPGMRQMKDTVGDSKRITMRLHRSLDHDALTLFNAKGEPLQSQFAGAIIQESGRDDRARTTGRSNYPDWKRVIPPFDKLAYGSSACYQPRYISEVQAALKVDKRIGDLTVFTVRGDDSYGANVIHFAGFKHVLYIVMPQRVDITMEEGAAWHAKFKEPAKKAVPA